MAHSDKPPALPESHGRFDWHSVKFIALYLAVFVVVVLILSWVLF